MYVHHCDTRFPFKLPEAFHMLLTKWSNCHCLRNYDITKIINCHVFDPKYVLPIVFDPKYGKCFALSYVNRGFTNTFLFKILFSLENVISPIQLQLSQPSTLSIPHLFSLYDQTTSKYSFHIGHSLTYLKYIN